MKKMIKIFSLAAVVAIVAWACNEHEVTHKDSNQDEDVIDDFDDNPVPSAGNGPITIIKCKIYRATTDRPRDGTNCGCEECLGLCECEGPFGGTVVVDTDLTSNTATVYICDPSIMLEEDFGIDYNDIQISSEDLPSGLSSLSLLQGDYPFTTFTETFTIGVDEYTSYGYAVVNISYTES